MWRIVSLKTFSCVILLAFAASIFLITRISSFQQRTIPRDKNEPYESRLQGKNDDGMHYYNNEGKNDKNDHRPFLKDNYPFDDNNDDDDPAAPAAHDDFDAGDEKQLKPNQHQQHPKESLSDITCDVNHGKYSIGCKIDDESHQVYIPFNFIQKYFEIYGKISETDPNKFIWLHSQVKIFKPKQPYNPKGVFTFFENYNVEVRDRVKCVSGSYGVPVSTQWDPNGYFYPIQIAQFGLSHYSKYIVEGEPTRIELENGDSFHGNWNNPKQIILNPEDDSPSSTNHIIEVKAAAAATQSSRGSSSSTTKLLIRNHKSRFLHLSWNMRIKTDDKTHSNLNVTLTVDVRYEKQLFHLHYTTGEFLIKAKDNNIYHGLGYESTNSWQLIIRDLGVDVQKGIGVYAKKKATKILKSKLVVESISISNYNLNGAPFWFDNLTLSSNQHLAQFFQAVDWFVSNQDERGGWSIPVKRKFGSEFYPELEPGWYSSMAMVVVAHRGHRPQPTRLDLKVNTGNIDIIKYPISPVSSCLIKFFPKIPNSRPNNGNHFYFPIGHGLSLLSRAYALTKNKIYSQACTNALETIFERSGQGNMGVKATFLNQLTWYEEYPTTPSTFVLNGFMYSLLGLYDVWKLEIPGAYEKAQTLYEDGLQSLITMLPLFDTGSGTMYDLRHFTVPGITPNLARLDYHVTHINQLLTFATIHDNKIFSTTAERWIGYTNGNRAPHN